MHAGYPSCFRCYPLFPFGTDRPGRLTAFGVLAMGKLSLSSRFFWQAILDRLFPGRSQRGRRQRPRTFSRPHLEVLEGRLAPAIFHVPAMTLANAIQTAAGGQDVVNTI